MAEIPAQGVAPTFKQLKDHLASMIGAESASDLPDNDEIRVGIYVNQAYRECYSPSDGYRPSWAMVNIGINVPAPASLTLTMTSDSAAVTTAGTVDSKYVGSLLDIGGDFFVVAATATNSLTMVTEWTGASGAQTGKLYHSSIQLDREVIDVEGAPELVGYGPMSPLNSPEVAIRLRGNWSTDFMPTKMYGNVPSMSFNKSTMETDDTPLFYYIDNSMLQSPEDSSDLQDAAIMGVRPRFNLFPLPSAAVSVRLKANVLPHELTGDTDIARLPGNVVWDILYPIACAKLALTDPRYNGGNTEAVLRSAEEARDRLTSLARPQKQKTIRLRKRVGW